MYIWGGLFSFVANSAIALFVLTRNPREKKNLFFCLFSLAVAGWSIGSFLANIIADKIAALSALRLNYLFGIWTPALYVHLVHTFDQGLEERNRKRLGFFYACSALLSPLVFTSGFIPSLRLIENHNFYISRPGPFYYAFFAYFALAMAEVIFQIVRGLRTKTGLELQQYKYLAVANILAILAGFEYFLRVFGVFSTPPMDDYILIIYVAILAYGVTRHRLFDVDALVRAFRKERLATLGLLTSSINHEIKNPVYIMKTLLENSLEGEAVDLSEAGAVKALLEKLYQQTLRISDLMTRYSKLIKDTKAKKSGEIKSASVPVCLDYALEVLLLVDKTKKVEISNQIQNNLPSVVITPGELEEVFINILFNAYHAVPGESGKISIAADLHDSRVKIKIEDNGTGMPAAQLKKLFKPFHLTKEGQGVGLGLYLTKEIIERCGGRISAKSKQSQGTSFEIELAAQQKSRVDGPGIMFNTSSKLPIINDEL